MKRILVPALVMTACTVRLAYAGDKPVTFARDVAPILYTQCAPCHRPGGAGPVSLASYDAARRRATLIAPATRDRYMPPWKPQAGDFVGERRLTDAQIAALGRW